MLHSQFHENQHQQGLNVNNFSPHNEYAMETSSSLSKISNFLEMKNISIEDFWQSARNYASAEDIIQFCKQCGLLFDIHNEITLKAQLFVEKEILSIYEFYEMIPFWKDKGRDVVSNFLKKRSQMLIEQLKKKEKRRTPSSHYLRAKSSHQSHLERPSSTSKMMRNPHLQLHNNFTNSNNSQKYLRRFKQRQASMERELAETIEKTKNQYQYGILLKMNELNDSNRKKNSSETFRAYKSAEGTIHVRVFNLNKFVKEISIKEFDRIYHQFKKKSKESKEWFQTRQSQYSKENTQVQTMKDRNSYKNARQSELKGLLMNTVNLTNLLKEQIKIFKMKGIYGCQDI